MIHGIYRKVTNWVMSDYPLHVAAIEDKTGMAEKLISDGFDPNANLEPSIIRAVIQLPNYLPFFKNKKWVFIGGFAFVYGLIAT